MLIRIIAALVFACALSAGQRAEAASGCPLPFILQNGVIPDASQVMADFFALQACVGGGGGGGGGTPINLGLTAPPEFTVAGSPYTGGSGVFAIGKAAENASTVWAGPAAGSPQPPTFRQLACADLAGGCGTPAATFTCATTPGSCPLSIPMFWPGTAPANQVVRISLADAVTCPAGLSLSEGSAKTAATGTPVVGIYQSVGGTGAPTLVATATFTGAVPAFAAASAINLAIGDVIQYQFPATPDATLADVSLTLHCNRTTGSTIGSTGGPLPDANIWIGNSMGIAAAQVPSGDLTMTDTGVFTVASNAITTGKINAAAVTYAKLQTESASSLLGNPTGSNATPSEITLGAGLSFSGTTLTATGTGGTVTSVTCGTGLTGGTFTTTGTCALDLTHANTWTGAQNFTVADQTLSGGWLVTPLNLGTISSGTTTIDCGARPLQFLTNGGAFTLAAPANDASCFVFTTNNASAGTITFSGFTDGANTGDALDTTNTHKFTISIWRINGTSGHRVAAHQ